jgi:hypothetical protein
MQPAMQRAAAGRSGALGGAEGGVPSPLSAAPAAARTAGALAGAKRARETQQGGNGGKDSGAGGSGARGRAHRGSQAAAHAPPGLITCTHCAAQFTAAAQAAHAAQGCPEESVRCAVPGCAASCTRAELAASPLGASHGAHAVALATRAQRAEAQLADAAQREAALTAQLAGADAVLRQLGPTTALNAAKRDGGVGALAAVMRVHAQHEKAYIDASTLLAKLLVQPGSVQAAASAGVIPAAVSALQMHPAHAGVQETSLHVLCVLTEDSASDSRDAAGAAAVDAALAALRGHAAHANVRELACLLLSNLTDASCARAEHAAAHGAVQLVMGVLQDGTLDEDCHEFACHALANLTQQATAKHDTISAAIASAGGIATLVDVLARYPAAAELQRFGGWALQLMLPSQAQAHAAGARAVSACLAALRAHTGDVNVQDTQLGVLMNLMAGHTGNACAAAAAGAVGVVLDALSAHGGADAELAEHAYGALEILFAEAPPPARADAARAKAALETHPHPQGSTAAKAAAAALAVLTRASSVKRE